MKKIIYIAIFISLSVSLVITTLAAMSFQKERKKVEVAKTRTISLALENYYYVTPNDVILGQYALKTGLFAFDNAMSSD
jgi:hypothetical protein